MGDSVIRGWDNTLFKPYMAQLKDQESGPSKPLMTGGITVSVATCGSLSVGTLVATVVVANAARHFLELTNDSDTNMYLSYGKAPAMNRGLRINANGGAHWINQSNLFTGALTVICGSTQKMLGYVEG